MFAMVCGLVISFLFNTLWEIMKLLHKHAQLFRSCLFSLAKSISLSSILGITCLGFMMLASTEIVFAAPPDTHLSFTRDVSVTNDHRQIRLVVSATGAEGHPIHGLTGQHFIVAVDGQNGQIAEISRVPANDQPLAVVLAIDISKSMVGGNAFGAARDAALHLIDELNDSDQVAIITFGNSATHILDFTQDKTKAKDSLEQLKATDNRTLLYEGLLQSTQEASLATTGKAVVIAITDGKDEGSNVTLEDVTGRAKSNGITIYTLGFGFQEDRKTLARISELTGGQYRHTVKAGELQALYQSILDELKDAYALKVNVQDLRSGSHNIAVALAYRSDKVTAGKQLWIPFRPVPRWLWIAGIAGVLLIVLAFLGLMLARQRRAKQNMFPIPAPSSPIWVDIVEGFQHGRQVRLLGGRLRIGTAPDCELKSNDSLLAPNQAEIIREQGGAVLLTNGQGKTPTTLNGNQLRPNESVKLRHGDRIKAGSLVVVFSDQHQARAASAKQKDPAYALKATRS
jgi:VWFA-related protein